MDTHPTGEVARSNLQTGARFALVGLGINIAFALIKLMAGVFGNAYALIADGIESALDVAGSIVIWGGLRFAARPPDATHPYGHGKAEPLAAIIVAFGVLGAAIVLAIQSVREIFLPHHAPAPFTLIVLIAVVVTKEGLFRYVLRFGQSVESTAVKTDENGSFRLPPIRGSYRVWVTNDAPDYSRQLTVSGVAPPPILPPPTPILWRAGLHLR